MKLFEVSGFYGSNETPTAVYCATDRDGLTWYVCDGGTTVNLTSEDVADGVNVELLSDIDCFTWSKPIESLDELESAIEA